MKYLALCMPFRHLPMREVEANNPRAFAVAECEIQIFFFLFLPEIANSTHLMRRFFRGKSRTTDNPRPNGVGIEQISSTQLLKAIRGRFVIGTKRPRGDSHSQKPRDSTIRNRPTYYTEAFTRTYDHYNQRDGIALRLAVSRRREPSSHAYR